MQNALEHALGGLSLRDFESGGMRVTHSVPGRLGPHVAATDIIKATTKTTQQNASQQWLRLKSDHPETTSGTCSFRFPGRRGLAAEVVDIPTALQIIMLLPGRAAAALRLKASVLLVRFLGGDLSLIAEIYDMNALQEHLREHWPEHPLVRFREAVEAAAVPARAAEGAVQHMDYARFIPCRGAFLGNSHGDSLLLLTSCFVSCKRQLRMLYESHWHDNQNSRNCGPEARSRSPPFGSC